MSQKKAWKRSRLAVLVFLLGGIVLLATGCVSGVVPVGWSGGTIEGNKLFVGAREGRLVSVDLETRGVQRAEILQTGRSTGLFGCSPYSGGGCGGGSSAVAIYGSPAVANDLVYIAGYNGKVYAYEQANISTIRWTYPVNGYLEPIVGAVTVSDGRVFFGDSEGIFYALDAATGQELWTFETGEKIWSTPAVDGDTVYFGSFDKVLYALDVSNGNTRWTFTADGAIIARPLVQNGEIYFGDLNNQFYALDQGSGSQTWKYQGAGNWFWATPVIVNGDIYAPNLDGNVYVLNASSGSPVTTYDLESGIPSAPVVVDGLVVVANREGLVYAIETQNEELRTLANIESTINGPLAAADGIVYIQSDSREIIRIDAATGALLQPIVLSS